MQLGNYGGWWEQWLLCGLANPDDYDGVEVNACYTYGEGDGMVVEVCDPSEAQFWSAYAHLKEGGVECIGDFETEAEARAYATSVQRAHGWKYGV